jgi:Xaa-Pro aminopeptidase
MGSTGHLGLVFEVLSADRYVWLTSQTGGIQPVDLSSILRLQKAVKSEWEILQITKAAEQAERLFREMAKHVRPGMSEIQLSASLEGRLREWGHGGTIRVRRPGTELVLLYAVSGNGALYPTHFDGPVGGEGPYPSASPGSGWKSIQKNETLLVDVVTFFNGYHTDQSRTYFIGKKIPSAVQQAHQFCLDVVSELEEELRPNQVCSRIFQKIHTWVKEKGSPEGFMGYDENRVRFYGHGIGLELDEWPIIAERFDHELRQGMTIALEPKAFLMGKGPVGIENTYVITEQGCRSLCTSPNGIQILG